MIRTLILRTLEILFDVVGVVLILGGAIAGSTALASLGLAPLLSVILGIVGFAFGGLAGLVMAALWLGPLLLLIDIKEHIHLKLK